MDKISNYQSMLDFIRRQEERTGNYRDPFPFAKERKSGQGNCNCKHDPARQKGNCLTCGGWRS